MTVKQMIDDDDETVTITVKLSPDQAWELAQMCKRAFFERVMPFAVESHEAYLMLDALNRVRRALDDVGLSPR